MRRVVKDRYVVPVAGRNAEVDMFRDKLEGLVLIDFEFDSSEDKNSFVQPEICLADITQERFVAGGELAGKDYYDIEPQLNLFCYKALKQASKRT